MSNCSEDLYDSEKVDLGERGWTFKYTKRKCSRKAGDSGKCWQHEQNEILEDRVHKEIGRARIVKTAKFSISWPT